jgi:hypothetical protein
MMSLHRIAVALATAGAVVSLSQAQTPTTPAPGTSAPVASQAPAQPQPKPAPIRRQSIVHHYQYPYPEHYYTDRTGGFRNPGGIGRYAEYYPPGGHYQNEGATRAPFPAATFDRGAPGTSRAEQMQAEALGVQRYNAIQGHIDNYARPYIGFGFGGYGGFY